MVVPILYGWISAVQHKSMEHQMLDSGLIQLPISVIQILHQQVAVFGKRN